MQDITADVTVEDPKGKLELPEGAGRGIRSR